MSLVEIVDQYGNPTGQIVSRDECFSKGLLKRCSWVVFFCQKRGILFQLRSLEKFVFPDKYDFTAAGHIDPGETPIQGALRETEEELWIILQEIDLHFCAMIASKIILPNNEINNELGYLYLVDWTGKTDNFTLQTEEVSKIRWFSLAELSDIFSQKEWPPDFVPHKNIFPWILILVRNKISEINILR